MSKDTVLKRFFSKRMLHDLLFGNETEVFDYVIRRYIEHPEGRSYKELISEIYAYMGRGYRTEYYYKNTMLNKLLLAKHDYRETVVLTELPIANSKADFIMINGKGIVYEIKTELDNLERLNSQIQDYYKAFTKIAVVTYKDNVGKVLDTVPENVGILELTKRGALKNIRRPAEYSEGLDYYTIFKILRKYEFESIILQQKYQLPQVGQFDYYKECYNIIKKIDLSELQKMMLKQLKQRTRLETVNLSVNGPEELRFLTYFDNIIASYPNNFFEVLNKNYGRPAMKSQV